MKIIKKIVSLFFIVLTIQTYGQEHPRCYTDELYEKTIKKDPSLKARRDKLDQNIIQYKNTKGIQKSASDATYPMVIPVVVYVIHQSGIGNISDTQVISQIDALNNGFDGTGISFCLATKAGSQSLPALLGGVQNTLGIIHINSAANAIHDVTTEQSALEALPSSVITGERYLRIWVVNDIIENGAATNIGGYTTMPGDNGIGGIVMKNNVFGDSATCSGCNLLSGYNEGESLVHEVGHYLGLYHTFYQGCDELSTNGDCSQMGDRICDTPPSVENFSCTPGLNTCGADNQNDDIENYMGYSNDTCKMHFTPDQIERMNFTINLYRSLMVSTDNTIYTGVCGFENIISANFEASNYSPCAGTSETITFQPTMTGVNYHWDFGDPGSTNNTSILQTPSHTYTSATQSPYTVTLTVTNGTKTSIEKKEIYVTTCSPIQNTQGHWYFSIKNGLDFSSGAPKYDNSAQINNIIFGEACAVQSDAVGNLLFYTNGTQVFNNMHTQINTGNLLLGHSSSHGGALIVPKPGSTTQYYIFTKDAEAGNNGFRYSIVNVTGTTASMSSIINVAIPPPPGCLSGNNGAAIGNEGITAIASCNGFWIITANKLTTGTQYFLSVYQLSSSGLSYLTGVNLPTAVTAHLSIIKASPDGNKIAYIAKNSGNFYGATLLYNFNKYTGAIANQYVDLDENFAYGASFSPDSKIFYTGGGNAIYQYNLLDANPAQSRRKIVAADGSTGDWQLGPDNKIYLKGLSSTKLSVIHKPNDLISENGNECQFTINGPLMEQNIGLGLPNLIDAKPTSIFTNQISSYPLNCLTYIFSSNICGSTYSWNFGDSINNTSTLANPQHTFSQPGEYTITVNVSGTIRTLKITVGGIPPVLSGNTTACITSAPQTYHSTSLSTGETIQWSIISGTGSMSVSTQPDVVINWTSLPGTVRVTTVDASGCSMFTDQEITSYCPGDICAPNIVFGTPETATNQTYKVSNSIVTQDNYRVSAGLNISLIAQNFIHIKTDSWIKEDSSFIAKIEDCSAPRPATKSNEVNVQKLIAYPNPTDGLLHLEGITFNEVYLYDILGKNIFFSKYDNIDATTIEMNALQQGVYLLKVVKTDGSTETLKIIKE